MSQSKHILDHAQSKLIKPQSKSKSWWIKSKIFKHDIQKQSNFAQINSLLLKSRKLLWKKKQQELSISKRRFKNLKF